jgi:peptidoglycan hydrolase-like protein with peptidoglycan-binding domain
METALFRSSVVKLGGNARDGLLYEPKTPGPNSRIAILYFNRNYNFGPPAAELAGRGYRVLFVSQPPDRSGVIPSPFDGFNETSQGIKYLRALPGVQRVVTEGWGAGAASMAFYADVAANGPATCQRKEIISPCTTEQATGLAKPDGMVLYDPGLGSGTRASNVDPAFEGDTRSKPDLDMFAAANGYDAKTGTAKYSAQFRKRYFAAQQALNDKIINNAIARRKTLGETNEPMFVAGSVNAGEMASLHRPDLSLLSHTKQPHTLLKADGSKPRVILRSIRPTTGPVGDEAVKAAVAKTGKPASVQYTLREYLANDAIRTTKDFALTEDDIIGIDWKTSNGGTPAQVEHVTIPTLIMTNTCFQFVVPTEIIYNHLASKDKTYAGVEGSEHFFTACEPQYGNPQQRLFDYVDAWLGKPARF